MILFLDTETRSPVPISHGTARYAASSEVIIVSWAVDYGKAQVWDVLSGRPMPESLSAALRNADEVWAHNAYFDRTNGAGAPLHLDKLVPMHKWRCSMALALSHGLPGGLDKLCDVFKVEQSRAKHQGGKDMIRLFCIPKKDGSYNDKRSHPEDWKRFLDYAKNDIPAMQEVHRQCPKWNYGSDRPAAKREVALWHLDQKINDRGFAVDVDFAREAVRATEAEKRRLAARTQELTEGEVERTTQRDRLLAHLLSVYGVTLPDLRADTIERRLNDPELPEPVKELLRMRQDASKASTSKYRRVLQMEVGGRMSGTLQFCAASRTRRWGGRGFQPQNLPRPSHEFENILFGIDVIKDRAEDLFLDDVMALSSSAIRSVIVAPEGKKLVISDLSNIEGRVLAWIAGEQWKLDAFAAFDAGHGPDLYKMAYARAFNIRPEDVTSAQRQIGKVLELAMGYQGGVGAFVTFAAMYGVDLEELAATARSTIPKSVLSDAESFWGYAVKVKRTYDLPKHVFIACDSLKRLWRLAHPKTTELWAAVERASKAAVANPGTKYKAGDMLTFVRQKAWMYMLLPSGGVLCYPEPRVDADALTYAGVCPYAKKWKRIGTHSGKTVENGVQGIARDIMAGAMPKAEAAGYEVVLTVHDELVTETPDTETLSAAGLSAILAEGEDWSAGLPLAAAGYETHRYRKD